MWKTLRYIWTLSIKANYKSLLFLIISLVFTFLVILVIFVGKNNFFLIGSWADEAFATNQISTLVCIFKIADARGILQVYSPALTQTVFIFVVLWNPDNVTLADRALLEVYQPLSQAVSVQDVFTDWNLHQSFLLFEILEAKAALSLLSHVAVFMWVGLCWVYGSEVNLLHDFEVYADDSICFGIYALIFIELAITAKTSRPSTMRLPAFLMLRKEKANHFDQHNE